MFEYHHYYYVIRRCSGARIDNNNMYIHGCGVKEKKSNKHYF